MARPAICDSKVRWARSNCPSSEALAPSMTKTVVKPATNIRAASMVRRCCSAAVAPGRDSSSSEVPLMKHK
jgi:hypothetical protein